MKKLLQMKRGEGTFYFVSLMENACKITINQSLKQLDKLH